MPKTTSTPTCSRDRTRLCAPVIVVLARFVVRLTDPATSDGVTVVPLTPCPFLLLMSCAARCFARGGVPRRGRPLAIRPGTKKPLGPGRAHRGVARGLGSDRVPPDYEERAHSPTVLRGPPGVNRRLPASRHTGRRSVFWTARRARSVADRAPRGRADQPRVLRQHAPGWVRCGVRPAGTPGRQLRLVDHQGQPAVRHVQPDPV